MSRRVTTKTNMTDKTHVLAAAKAAGWDATESGGNINFRSGPLRNASLNLASGEIVGDSDYHTKKELGALHQGYAEMKFRAEAAIEGVQINERLVERDGTVRLKCRMSTG